MIKQTVKSQVLEFLNKNKDFKEAAFVFWSGLTLIIAYLLHINLGTTLFLIALCVYFRLRGFQHRRHRLLHLTLLFLVNFVAGQVILSRGLDLFYLPFSIVPMLAILLFGEPELALLLTIAVSISLASLSDNPFLVTMLSLFSGITALLMVRGARKRTRIIKAGLAVGFLQTLLLFCIDRFWFFTPQRYLVSFLNGVISSGIVLGVLPVFEYLFQKVTNISLLELADFNHPLLQRMILEAPGTYHHSLVVGNLSETACQAVGANALLARIGAYYHDIGKLQKPTYFSENQETKGSKHDGLSPTMSKLIIMNHVKEGAELAKKYHLNPSIIDFIMQHHGNSLVYYFYRRALESLEECQQIKEEGFRYPGPKPDTKETAIVLLADSVEAATRALKEPTLPGIEELVRKVINNKFIDGQLDECDLTLKDLEKISSIFIRILSGIYHSRVGYPEEPRSASNHKKLSKEDSHQPEKDKGNGS
jgi:cyclic-di-AMP phosphodiesterase PgpH